MSKDIPGKWVAFENVRDNHHKSLLFLISRDQEETFYLYKALRINDALVAPYVEVKCVEMKNLNEECSISDVILKNFCGINVTPIDNTFFINMVSLPERKLKLRLKKEHMRVTASMMLSIKDYRNYEKIVDGNLEVNNCEVFIVFLSGKSSALGIPDITSIDIYARTPFQEIVNALKLKGITDIEQKAKMSTVFYVTEHIVITPEMKQRYNAVDLIRQFSAETFSITSRPAITDASKNKDI